jgi:hypothetical protein
MNGRRRRYTVGLLVMGLLLAGCQARATPTPVPAVELTVPGLVLYYPFSGDARDLSGNHSDAKVHGVTLTTDRFGVANHAYHFDGVDNYLSFDPSRLPLGSSPRTISAWVKAESWPPELFAGLGSRPTVIGWGVQDWDQLSELQLVDGRLQFHTYGAKDSSGTVVLELNQWYHLAIVYSEGQINLYVNGVGEQVQGSAIDTQVGTGRVGTWPDPPQPVASDWKNLGYFHGTIDDVSVYNQALTAVQIQTLYAER